MICDISTLDNNLMAITFTFFHFHKFSFLRENVFFLHYTTKFMSNSVFNKNISSFNRNLIVKHMAGTCNSIALMFNCNTKSVYYTKKKFLDYMYISLI